MLRAATRVFRGAFLFLAVGVLVAPPVLAGPAASPTPTPSASGTLTTTPTPTPTPMPTIPDLDGDEDVDRDDLNILLADRNRSVGESSCGAACDLDMDGLITALDARKLVLECTRPACATE